MVDLLSIHGPLTTAELAGHLYPEQRDVKLRGQAAWAATKSAMDAGIIERREHNGVDKWALPQSAK